MKKHLIYTLITLFCTNIYAQEKLVKDIDFDGIKDTVYINTEKSVIVCKLSTQDFKISESKAVEINKHAHISESKNGFKFSHPEMRSGFSAQFRYDKNKKRVQLIGMVHYSFGNAANDGSGEASVNLLTNRYIGNWNYYDYLANNEEGELVKIPTIKSKMNFGKIYLEDFSEAVVEDCLTRSAVLTEKYEKQLIEKRKKK